MLLAIAMFAAVPKVSNAQCPDQNTPDPGPPWNGPYNLDISIPGTTCRATVTYCSRNNDGGTDWETYIEAVAPYPQDTCKDPQTVIVGAYNYFAENGDPTDIYVPPCGDGTQTVHTYALGCWYAKYSTDPNCLGCVTYYVCKGSSAYCESTCHVCYDSNLKQDVFSDCTETSHGYHDCEDAPPYPWPPDQCYFPGDACGPL